MQIKIDGREIRSEHDLHAALKRHLDLGPYYGNNLNALWDVLTTDVERPLRIIWYNSEATIAHMKQRFDIICEVLTRLAEQEKSLSPERRFEFEIHPGMA